MESNHPTVATSGVQVPAVRRRRYKIASPEEAAQLVATVQRRIGPSGRWTVPVPALLRDHLVEHRMGGRRSEGLEFGRTADKPFHPSTVVDRARRAWREAELEPIGLHDCRHTFASLMIAAGDVSHQPTNSATSRGVT